MKIRKILFWVHLTLGSFAGVVILIMSFTGVLLAYQRQITDWANRGYRSELPYRGAMPLPVGRVMAGACVAESSAPSAVTLHSDPARPIEIAFGRDRTVLFNSYTGAPIGVASQRARKFFQNVEGWHRWLGVSIQHRAAARFVTGTSTLLFLVLVSTGIVLWWPRSWSLRRLKSAAAWRWNVSTARGRPWNWHTVTGFWCFLPLFVIVFCGVIMAFPWATNLLYRATGNLPPMAPPAPSQEVATPSFAAQRNAGRQHQRSAASRPAEPCAGWAADRLNGLWDRAEHQVPGWQTITWRVASNPVSPASFSIDRGNGGRPDQRAQLTIDSQTGSTIRWEPFSSYNLGRRLRAWVRFSHTGEAGGLLGETIAVLATTGTMVLVVTGLTMAWKRFWARILAFVDREGPSVAPRRRPAMPPAPGQQDDHATAKAEWVG